LIITINIQIVCSVQYMATVCFRLLMPVHLMVTLLHMLWSQEYCTLVMNQLLTVLMLSISLP